jgi:hypothetical protein
MENKNLNSYIFEKFVNYGHEFRLHVTEDGCFYTCRKALKENVPENEKWRRHDDICVWFLEENESFHKPNSWDDIVNDCVKALKSIGADILSFDVKFVPNPDPKKINEKQANNDIDEVIYYWREAFMSLLIKRYKDYKINGLFEPEPVLVVTRKYQYNSDLFAEYIQESLRITNNENDAVHIRDLFEDFKFWHKEMKQIPPKMDRNQFKSEIEDKLGKICGNEFLGIQLRTIDDHPNLSMTESEAKINSTINTEKFNQLNNFKSNNDSTEIKYNTKDSDNNLSDTIQLKNIFIRS